MKKPSALIRLNPICSALRTISANSLFALTLIAPLAIADNTTGSVKYFDTIVVTSSKNEQKLGDVAGSIDVITGEQIEKNMVDSVDDLFKYTPSVTVSGAGIRGNSPINIRGISDNRILVTVDGVRQPKTLSFGFLESSRHFIDVNTLKQVEVVPGPASSLYGSDALGGTVAYTTKDPSDIYTGKGNGSGGNVSVRYNGADDGLTKTAELAARAGSSEFMAIITHRDANEVENNDEVSGTGSTREMAAPETFEDKNFLGKVVYHVDKDQQFKFTFEHTDTESETDALSGSLADTKYYDDKDKTRFSVEYDLSNAETSAYDDVNVKFNWQNSNTDQLATYISRGAAASYDSDYRESDLAVEVDFSKTIEAGSTEHLLTYGFSYENQEFQQLRDSSSSGVARGMPVSTGDSYAVYLQDQITLADSGIKLVPGIRYDHYTISPEPDADFLAINPTDASPAENKGNQVSLKLGATFDINDSNSFFAQFAQGYKAPDMDQLYETFNRVGLYAGEPNPNLKPESVDSYEIGYRFIGDKADAELVFFHNDYTDFIESVSRTDPAYPFGISQNQNLTGVEIRGFEFKGSVDVTDDISLRGAVTRSKGTYEQNGTEQPLNSIAPMHGTVAVAYTNPSSNWGTELSLTASAEKKASDVDDDSDHGLLPDSYEVLDLTGYYNVSKKLRLQAGIFNILDDKYWEWESVRNGSVKPEAARHFKIGLSYQF